MIYKILISILKEKKCYVDIILNFKSKLWFSIKTIFRKKLIYDKIICGLNH